MVSRGEVSMATRTVRRRHFGVAGFLDVLAPP
jgi:hypothetical protein